MSGYKLDEEVLAIQKAITVQCLKILEMSRKSKTSYRGLKKMCEDHMNECHLPSWAFECSLVQHSGSLLHGFWV